MKDLFAELRSALHHPSPDLEHIARLLDSAREEHWTYARPFLDKFELGNLWAFAQGETTTVLEGNPLESYDEAQFAVGELVASHILQLHASRGLDGGYARVIWTRPVRLALHAWMATVLAQRFETLPLGSNASIVLNAIDQLGAWARGRVEDDDLRETRRTITAQWMNMGPIIDTTHRSYNTLEQTVTSQLEDGVRGAFDALASFSLTRMVDTGLNTIGQTARAGVSAVSQFSLDMIRQQWLIWMLLCALDISKAPLLRQFARLAAQYNVLDAINRRIDWTDHPLRVLVYIEGMLQEQLRERDDIRNRNDEAHQALGQSLSSFLTIHTSPSFGGTP